MTVGFRSYALVAGALWLLLAGLALRPADALFALPVAEDGWYALTVARNLATGLGLTIDGTTWTNGFQPLFTFFEAACFALAGGDTELGLRLVFVLAALVHGAGALLVASLARDAWDGDAAERGARAGLALVGYLAAIKAYNDFYTGLETGLQLALYAAVWRLATREWRYLAADRVAMGVLLGALVLTRIDAAVFVAFFCANELRRARPTFAQAFGRCLVVGTAALVVSAPWWLYNTLVFGHPMPVSGFAQQDEALSPERALAALHALRMVAVPWLFAGAFEAWWSDALRILAIAGFALLAWRGRRRLRGGAEAGSRDFAVVLACAYASLVPYYAYAFFADWFYPRYFAPLALIAFVYVPVFAVRLAQPAAPFAAAAAAGAAAFLLVLAWRGEGIFGASANHAQVALVDAFVPPEDLVAAGQSGTLGFFRANVVNVDGKVNPEALEWRGRMTDYLDRRGIVWFADAPWYVETYLGPDPGARGWIRVAEDDGYLLYRRVPR
jgi:hypothetical protein